MVSFGNRSICVDEVSQQFLSLLVALGGYCTATQAQELFSRPATQVRARLKTLERLGFLRRITKYPVVYQVTKSSTRLLKRDSSSRRRHTPATVQARLLGVHFYLEARPWPSEFVLDHEKKIAVFTDLAGCPVSVLPQRGGKPYLREHFLLWQPDWRLGLAMIDLPKPGVLTRLKVFIREFLPLLRYFRTEPDLFIVTADKGRRYTYERLLKRHRAILKLGLGELSNRVKTLLRAATRAIDPRNNLAKNGQARDVSGRQPGIRKVQPQPRLSKAYPRADLRMKGGETSQNSKTSIEDVEFLEIRISAGGQNNHGERRTQPRMEPK